MKFTLMFRAGCAVALVSFLTVSAAHAADAPEADEPPEEAAPVKTHGRAPMVAAADVAEESGPVRPPDLSYGAALIGRWVSVPAWLLNSFTKKNVPLSSYGVGAELFRRKGNFQVGVSFVYQNMSPQDGNWLGKGDSHPAATDTDYVQFRGVALYAVDVSFVWTQMLNNWFGLHYGAGIGFGIVGGHILRTSNSPMVCTEANAGNPADCYPISPTNGPVDCANGICSEQQLKALGAGPDDPNNPHRFTDPNLPPVLPIVNVVVGIDFRLPNVRGWEARIEGGFYDAFVVGGAVAYTF
jgi:hypothetical protein